MKKSLIIIALALLACLVVLGSRPDEPVGAGVAETSRGPSFEVRVVVPRLGLPVFGILPDPLVAQLDGTPRELGFDHASRGAGIGSVGPDRLELRADGWDLSIEADGEGRVAPGTRLVFPLGLGGTRMRLRCRPVDRGTGYLQRRLGWVGALLEGRSENTPVPYLRTTTRAGSEELGGRFLVKLATCENAGSGKTMNWPPAPLTVRGSFEGLPRGRR